MAGLTTGAASEFVSSVAENPGELSTPMCECCSKRSARTRRVAEVYAHHVEDAGGHPSTVGIHRFESVESSIEILAHLDDQAAVQEDIRVVQDLLAIVFARPNCRVADEGRFRSLRRRRGRISVRFERFETQDARAGICPTLSASSATRTPRAACASPRTAR